MGFFGPRFGIFTNFNLATLLSRDVTGTCHLKSAMLVSRVMANNELEDLCAKIPVLSEYARSLDAHIMRRYLEKISVIGVDPATLPSEQFLP